MFSLNSLQTQLGFVEHCANLPSTCFGGVPFLESIPLMIKNTTNGMINNEKTIRNIFMNYLLTQLAQLLNNDSLTAAITERPSSWQLKTGSPFKVVETPPALLNIN